MAYDRRFSIRRAPGFKKTYRWFKNMSRPYVGAAGSRNIPENIAEGSERLYGPFLMEGLYGKVKTYMRLGDYIRMRIDIAWKKACSRMIGIAIRAIRVGVKVKPPAMGIGCSPDGNGGWRTPNEAEIIEALGDVGFTADALAKARAAIVQERDLRRINVPYFDYEIYKGGAMNPQSLALSMMSKGTTLPDPRASVNANVSATKKRQRTQAEQFVRAVDDVQKQGGAFITPD